MDDRELLEARYTAPSGKEFVFLWEKLSKTIELKTGVFVFPDKDGAHVQHQGGGPVSFPMTCIFNGANHARSADDFEEALHERDVAELQHPVYGIRKVIPTGNISRDNNLIERINESIVTITFTETLPSDPLILEAVTADELVLILEDFENAAAYEFADNIIVENISEQLEIQSSLNVQADILTDNLLTLVPDDPELTVTINELKNSIDTMFESANERESIGALLRSGESAVQKRLNTARLALNAMRQPSQRLINVLEKVRGYSLLIAQIRNQFRNDPFGLNNIRNVFASTRLTLSGAIASIATGSALSIAQNATNNTQEANTRSRGDFSTADGVMSREAAVAIAIQLNTLLSTIQNHEDTKIEQNNFIDSNATAYYKMIKVIYYSINLIFIVALSLPMKKIIKLDRDRNIIELCAEIYGSVDNFFIDKLIVENYLSIDDMEIIPMGREVSYYV